MLLLNEFSLSISCLFRNIPIQCIVVPAERIGGLGIWEGGWHLPQMPHRGSTPALMHPQQTTHIFTAFPPSPEPL